MPKTENEGSGGKMDPIVIATLKIMFIFLLLCLIGLVIAHGICTVPTFNHGAVRRFKKLTGRKVGPGLVFVLPFIEDVLIESAGAQETSIELKREPIIVNVISKNRLQIDIKGSIQFRMDPEMIDAYIRLGKDALKGIADAIQSELGASAGAKLGDDFISKRTAIQDMINCVLRLEKPPHLIATAFGYSEDIVLPTDRLDFYEANMSKIKTALVAKDKSERSKVEKRYGIEIVTFELTHVDFSAETQKALEKLRQAEAEMQAAEEIYKKKLKVYNELRGPGGLTPQQAMNAADITVGQAEKRKVISLEGIENIFGGKD